MPIPSYFLLLQYEGIYNFPEEVFEKALDKENAEADAEEVENDDSRLENEEEAEDPDAFVEAYDDDDDDIEDGFFDEDDMEEENLNFGDEDGGNEGKEWMAICLVFYIPSISLIVA